MHNVHFLLNESNSIESFSLEYNAAVNSINENTIEAKNARNVI